MNTKIHKILRGVIPPALAWRLGKSKREQLEQERFVSFYQQFLKPGDCCFDIGANLGNRTRSFQAIGCRVVAVEPQSSCLAKLTQEFGSNPDVVIVAKAAGSSAGTARIQVSPDHVLSSMSPHFIDATKKSGRFSNADWSKDELIDVTTLDALIAEFGIPQFIKIDVEGHEAEVLAGLSTPVPALSFEWVPELHDHARACIMRLGEIGNYEFNISWGESMKFSRKEWRSAESILTVIGEFQDEAVLFGDIYARTR